MKNNNRNLLLIKSVRHGHVPFASKDLFVLDNKTRTGLFVHAKVSKIIFKITQQQQKPEKPTLS